MLYASLNAIHNGEENKGFAVQMCLVNKFSQFYKVPNIKCW